MKTAVVKSGRSEIVKVDAYEEFILWYALPADERKQTGIKNQNEFANKFSIHINSLSNWKKRPDFRLKVKELRHEWAHDKTGEVIKGIYKAAIRGNPHSQKLWMQVFEDFSEKSEVTTTNKVELGVNDIRFIIEGLPEPYRTEHYANLRKLIDDAEMVRSARLVEDERLTSFESEESVSDQAYTDASDVSHEEPADEVAFSDTAGLRRAMERSVLACDYQSSTWWW